MPDARKLIARTPARPSAFYAAKQEALSWIARERTRTQGSLEGAKE